MTTNTKFDPTAASAPATQVFALPPKADVFADRARRFAKLADGHPQNEWLHFLSALAQAQNDALRRLPELPLPSDEALRRANEFAMPPLSIASLPLDAAWRNVLRGLIGDLQAQQAGLPEPTQRVFTALGGSKDNVLDALARQVLDHDLKGAEERAAGLFVAAALQVYWTGLASRIDGKKLVRLEVKRLCPCCGSLPVGSVVRHDGDHAGRRYLHCALCNTQWNLVRVTCVQCEDTGKVSYQSLEGHHPAVRAETCDTCDSYLKIFYLEKDPDADPVADDLASVALDLLLGEGQYRRAGPNFFLIPDE